MRCGSSCWTAIRSPRTEPPANVARKTTVVWTADEVRRFLDHVHGHRLSLAFQLLATTGMRRGELLGLRWGDVDWERGALSVVRSLGLVDGELVTSTTKTTTSRRLLFLDSVTLDHLRSDFERAIAAGVAGVGDPLIAGRHGGLVHPDSFSNTFDRLRCHCRCAPYPSARPATHVRDVGAPRRHAPRCARRTPRTLHRRHHHGPLRPRHPSDLPRRRRRRGLDPL